MAMKIDLYQRRVAQPTSQSGSFAGVSDFSSGAGLMALADSSERINAVMEKVKNAERSADVSNEIAALKIDTDEYYAQRSIQPDSYDSLEADVRKDFEERRKSVLDRLGDNKTRTAFQMQSNSLYVTAVTKARSESRKQFIDNTKAKMSGAIRAHAKNAIEASNVFEVDASLRRIKQTINDAVDNFILDADGAETLKDKTLSSIYENRARRRMLVDPDEVAEQINDRDIYPYINEKTRTTLMASAQKAAVAKERRDEVEQNRIDREEEQKLKIEREQEAVSFFVRLNSRNLDYGSFMADIEKSATQRKLSDGDYRRLYGAVVEMQKGGGKTDPATYNEIAVRVHMGMIESPGDVWEMAGKGLDLKDIKELSSVVLEGKPIFKSRDYKESAEHLRRMMGESPGMLSMLSGKNDSVRVGRAIRELYFRVKGGEKPWDVVDEMIPRYMKKPTEGMPKPRYNTTKAALDAFVAGSIDKTAYDREVSIIKALEDKAARRAERENTNKGDK